MSPTVVLATRNPGKLVELRRMLAAADLDVTVAGLDEVPGAPAEIPETELTFSGNALLKARAVARAGGLPAIADDSGLCVAALNGMPGVFSARWSGRHGDDRANLELLLGQLADVPERHRQASFVCVAALVLPSGEERTANGRLAGRLVGEPRGRHGFGYDPIFVPEGDDRTTAEMPPADKDAISHRGRALRALLPEVANLLVKT